MHRFERLTVLFSALLVGLTACSITAQETPETTTTPVAESPASSLVLLDDGIGPYKFGDSANAVIEGVSATIGGWNADSSENDAVAPPVCEQGRGRILSWGSLVLTFVESSGTEAFTGWTYGFDPVTGNADDNRGLGLRTPDDITLGSSRQDLIDAYGSRVSMTDDTVVGTATFVVSDTTPTALTGNLDGTGESGNVDFLGTMPNC